MSSPTLLTSSGVAVNPFAIDQAAISIYDIAHHLSNLCRFNGAVRVFYSVAEHSVRVSRQAERLAVKAQRSPADAKVVGLYGLLHDASEAYISDVTRPVKATAEFEAYRRIEADLQYRLYAHFGLIKPQPSEVTTADDQLLAREFVDLMPTVPEQFIEPATALAPIESPMRQHQAKRAFLVRFDQLTGGNHAS